MKRLSYSEKLIHEELEGHILDCVDELVATGHTAVEANTLAKERFGDFENIATTVASVNQPIFSFRLHPRVLLNASYIVVAILFYAVFRMASPTVSDYAQIGLLWIAQLGYIGLMYQTEIWMLEYTGLVKQRAAWSVLALSIVSNISLLIILDVDHFEVILHNLVLLALVTVMIRLFWAKWPIAFRKYFLHGISLVTTSTVLTNQKIFEWAYKPKCLYITPDPVTVTGCVKIEWFHFLLWPLYLAVFAALVYLVYGLITYWKNLGTARTRKIVLSLVFGGLVLLPLFIYDINNKSELDIIPWKYKINQAYLEILGRYPEQKDIDFYAASRAFEHMTKVRETLYRSPERKVKINKLYREVVGRDATSEELQRYVTNQSSVTQIYAELQNAPR